ncbi:MAG: enoyl-CoA hydratase/isomerase family protein [Archangiaceae bacterium]|nr:enoyl-CoA hydratase/isomerase family protein [Archangiaceae bacterium]
MSQRIELRRVDDIVVVQLNGGRANAMSVGLLTELEATFAEIARGDAAAVVLTGTGKAFSAGLALPDLINLDRNEMRDFITSFERSMQRVLACPKPVVAAINGHAIAGGCVLALMCDVRIAADGPANIGLNESQLGIGLPSLVIEPLRARVSPSAILPIAYEGRLFSVQAAQELGLLDQVVPTAELDEKCLQKARLLGRSPLAFAQMKQALLRPVLASVEKNGQADREAWLDSWFSPAAQKLLRSTVALLSRK